MKSISVREMKANWSEIERQVNQGEEITVLNRGRPTARIGPASPAEVAIWDDHLATAARPKRGLSSEAALRVERDERW